MLPSDDNVSHVKLRKPVKNAVGTISVSRKPRKNAWGQFRFTGANVVGTISAWKKLHGDNFGDGMNLYSRGMGFWYVSIRVACLQFDDTTLTESARVWQAKIQKLYAPGSVPDGA